MMLVARLLLALAVIVDVSAAVAQGAKPETVINGIPLTEQQRAEFRRMYGVAPLAGAFTSVWRGARATGSTGTGSGRVDFIVGCD